MVPFRVLQFSIVVLVLFGSTWLVRAIGMAASPSGSSSTWLSRQDALADVLQQGDNGGNGGDNGDNGGGNGDNGGDNGGNNGDNGGNNGDNGGNNGDNGGGNGDNGGDNGGGNGDNGGNGGDNNGNGNSNDSSFDENDNFNLGFPPSSTSSEPRRPPERVCSTPGQETAFTSHDDRVTVRVFGTSPLPVRVMLYQVINADTAPAPPGAFVRPLVYEVAASYCGDTTRLTEFPAEVNLGIRYSDLEAVGLDEGRFVIGRLDLDTAIWVPVEKQANDPPANYVSATITQTGYYMVWEAR